MKKEHQLHMLRYTLTEQIVHGMEVSNLAYDVSLSLIHISEPTRP